MDVQQARENSAKPQDVQRGGAGDMDHNTTVLRTSNVNAETNELYTRNATGGFGASVLDPAQSAQLCLLAAKSPKSNLYKKYDKTRRSRTFIPHWVVEYPWLEFNPEKECMFCVYCREYQATHDSEFSNTFVHGATNFRLDSVKAHDNSTKHRQVMLVMNGKIAGVPKTASKQRSGGGQGTDQIDRLRVGAFFDSDVDGYDDPQMIIATGSADEVNSRHIHVSQSSDLTEQPFYPINPMAKYIKTLQNVYPHLPLNEMTSLEPHPATNHHSAEPLLATNQPSSHSSSSSSRMEDASSQVMVKIEMEEGPVSQEEQVENRSYDDREPDVGEVSSHSVGAGMTIGRSAPMVRKVWHVNESSQEEEEEEDDDHENGGEYDQTVTGEDGVPNELSDHPDQEYEAEPAEGLLQRSGAVTDYFISPTVPVFRQGKRSSRLLPKAKRQKLERILARQMLGDDMMNVGDSLGDQQFEAEPKENGVNSSSSKDRDWKRLAESFARKYNQLCEEHTSLIKLFQTKVSGLEKKCNNLEKACESNRQKVPPISPNGQDDPPGTQGTGSQASPRINMYSSVVVLQVQGHDPIHISSNSDENFHAVQQNLSQNGIHISLGGNSIPNNMEQQFGLHGGAGDQRSHSTVSSASPRKSGEASASGKTDTNENISRSNVSQERAETDSREDDDVSESVSGVGLTLQKDSETKKSDLSGNDQNKTDDKKHGYLLGNGNMADDSVLSGDGPSITRTNVSAPLNISDVAEDADILYNPGCATVDTGLEIAGDHQRSAPSDQEKDIASRSDSSNSNGMI